MFMDWKMDLVEIDFQIAIQAYYYQQSQQGFVCRYRQDYFYM